MRIASSAFLPGEIIPARYTCDGENISPELLVYEVPAGTQSLALVADDPDSPTGTWIHWLAWNIPPETTLIPAGDLPESAIEGMTSFNERRYGGPCPGSGEHRYFFKLFALDTILNLDPATTDTRELERVIEGHIVGRAETMGRYRRMQ